MTVPERIQPYLIGKTGHTDNIGMSGSFVTVYEDCVLKMDPVTSHSQECVAAMDWLSRRLPTPKVLCHEIVEGKSWLLMSRIPGKMSCDEEYLSQPDMLVTQLAAGLELLWHTDTTGCPKRFLVEDLLAEATYRVENNLVDLENTEPDTFGKDGFRDPEELLQWLREHKPASVPTLAHGDYCLPNIFLKDGVLSGFIDIGDMGIGEKWRDIALCWRSLKHNLCGTYGYSLPGFDPDILFAKLNIQPNPHQLRWHLLLDELF